MKTFLLRVLGQLFHTKKGVRDEGRYCRPALEVLEDRLVPSGSNGVTSIQSNFNGTAIAAGSTLWFSSAFKVNGVGSTPVTLQFINQTITFTAAGTSYTVAVPDANVTIDPSATTASTTFNPATSTAPATWNTTLPKQFSGNGFLDGVALPTPAGLPGGINPVTWQGTMSSNTPSVNVNWQWATAVYTSFSTDYNALNVKPTDDNQVSLYQNSDHAGTPEAYTSFVTGGARGGGGSNFTGSLSATSSVLLQPGSLSGYVWANTIGNGLAGATLTLTDNTTGQVIGTFTTGSDGSYCFTGLLAGSYTIKQTYVPSGYTESSASVGTVNGSPDGNPSNGALVQILLTDGNNGINYDFVDVTSGGVQRAG